MKVFKNVVLNLICISLLLVLTDFMIYFKFLRNGMGDAATFNIVCKEYLFRYHYFSVKELENRYILDKYKIYRKIENKDSKLPPILIFSDCFLFSYGIDNEKETYSYFLGKMTKRPVYNRSLYSLPYQYMLFQLKNEKFYNVIPKPKDLIYTLKLENLTTDVQGITPWIKFDFCYKKDKNGNLVFHKYLLSEQILSKKIFDYLNFKNVKDTKDIEDLFLLSLKECKKEVENHWGKDVNFYILVAFENYSKYESNIKELEKLGFKIIFIEKSFYDNEENFLESQKTHLSKIGDERLAKYTISIMNKN
ncbi:MAG: hypothetical protein MJ229_00265 [bacterium]|nr:hypothetical protein [bacterium]